MVKKMETVADRVREDLREVPDAASMPIAAELLGEYREVTPKRLIAEDIRGGADPGASLLIWSSNPVPQDHVFHAYLVENQLNIVDPAVVGVQDIFAYSFTLFDLEPYHHGGVGLQGLTVPAAITAPEVYSVLTPVDYFFPQGTVMSIFTFNGYGGGNAATILQQIVQVWGELLEWPTQMRRGTGQVPPANLASWNIILNKYGSW